MNTTFSDIGIKSVAKIIDCYNIHFRGLSSNLRVKTLTAVLSRSNSEAARQVDDQLAKVNRRLQRSVALGHESHIRGELTDVFMETILKLIQRVS